MPSPGIVIALHRKVATVKILALLLLAAVVAGCAAPALRAGADNPAQVTHSVNLSGFPPEYKRGFTAGCESAKDTPAGSAQRPKGEASFVQGWQDGLDYCRPRKPR
jgi:hypothetical protein